MIRRPVASRHEYSWACTSDGVSAQSSVASTAVLTIFPLELNSLARIDRRHKGKHFAAAVQQLTGGLSADARRFCTRDYRSVPMRSGVFAMSSSILDGSLPPASAKSGRPPPPPPTIGA